MVDGFGLAWDLRNLKPPWANPKLGLSGQARLEHHYLADLRVCSKAQVEGFNVQLSLEITCSEALKV